MSVKTIVQQQYQRIVDAAASHAGLRTPSEGWMLTAEAMGCRFVYAVVPEKRIEDVIMAQARKKAMALVGTASTHMALESQNLPSDKIAQEIERLTREIAQEMPPDFWSDK
jgi:predicted DNA-binding mobile mystery protein A